MKKFLIILVLVAAPCLIHGSMGARIGSHVPGGFFETLLLLPVSLFLTLFYVTASFGNYRETVLSLFFVGAYCYLQISPFSNGFDIALSVRAQALCILIPFTLSMMYFLNQKRLSGIRGIFFLMALSLPLSYLLLVGSQQSSFFQNLAQSSVLSSKQALPLAGLVLGLLFAYGIGLVQTESTRIYRTVGSLSLIPIFLCLANYASSTFSVEALQLHSAIGFTATALLFLYGTSLAKKQSHLRNAITGIPNHRALEADLKRIRTRYSIATTDINFFERIQKIYGPEESENVVRFAAKHLHRTLGLKLYHSKEKNFTILAKGKDDIELAQLMEEAKEQLEQCDFYVRQSHGYRKKRSARNRRRRPDPIENERFQISLSIGIAGKHRRYEKPQSILAAAAEALKSAKKQPSKRIVVGSTEPQLQF